MTAHGPSLARTLAVVGIASAAATAVVGLAGPALSGTRDAAGSGTLAPDDALVGLCAAVAVAAATWLWSGTCLVALAALRGRSGAGGGLPAPLRRVVLAGCGVAVSTGLTGLAGLAVPADATPGSPHEARAPIAGLPFPDRALGQTLGKALGQALGQTLGQTLDPTVRVRAGDSLWSLAAEDLGPTATDAAVDARWRAIYRLNRAEIGPDPDLIRPAQRLRLPLPHRG